MSRVWFDQPLETAATFWRVLRRDGVALGFTALIGVLSYVLLVRGYKLRT